MSSKPAAIFTAVLYSKSSSSSSSDPSLSLHEPLLPPSTTTTMVRKTSSNNKATSSDDMMTQSSLPCMWRLKLLSFVTGSVTAALSQAVLGHLLWMDDLLMGGGEDGNNSDDETQASSSLRVIGFSLLWSFWTCVMIFCTMLVLVRCVLGKGPCASNSKNGDKAAVTKQWEDVVFQMEAHHIVGALLSISAIWVAFDVLQSAFKIDASSMSAASSILTTTSIQNAILFTMGLAWYFTFCRCILKKNNKSSANKNQSEEHDSNGIDTSLLSTYQLIAATLGLISGLCSQFLLSFLLWKDNMSQPVIDHVILFSVLWSFCTVVLTFLGCLSLRLLTVDESTDGADNSLNAERIFLRMESHYIFCSLIGICSAWILIDMVMDMREQILPSILMLAVSLAAFGAIVHCFPEEQCLAELQAEADATVALVEREKRREAEKQHRHACRRRQEQEKKLVQLLQIV